jgi:hypothetical protein
MNNEFTFVFPEDLRDVWNVKIATPVFTVKLNNEVKPTTSDESMILVLEILGYGSLVVIALIFLVNLCNGG